VLVKRNIFWSFECCRQTFEGLLTFIYALVITNCIDSLYPFLLLIYGALSRDFVNINRCSRYLYYTFLILWNEMLIKCVGRYISHLTSRVLLLPFKRNLSPDYTFMRKDQGKRFSQVFSVNISIASWCINKAAVTFIFHCSI